MGNMYSLKLNLCLNPAILLFARPWAAAEHASVLHIRQPGLAFDVALQKRSCTVQKKKKEKKVARL